MSKCAIIVSGGTLDEALAFETLREYEEPCVIGVDRGVEFLYHHKIRPNYIVGDFDSLPEEIVTYYKERNDVPIREFNSGEGCNGYRDCSASWYDAGM